MDPAQKQPSQKSYNEEIEKYFEREFACKADQFRKRYHKITILRYPRLIIHALHPITRRSPYRNPVIEDAKIVEHNVRIVIQEMVPEILTALKEYTEAYKRWLDEYSTPGRYSYVCFDSYVCVDEKNNLRFKPCEKVRALSAELLETLEKIENYSKYFHPIESPAKMIDNPSDHFLSCVRAMNYCKHLLAYF